jgi:hypothetical protein
MAPSTERMVTRALVVSWKRSEYYEQKKNRYKKKSCKNYREQQQEIGITAPSEYSRS